MSHLRPRRYRCGLLFVGSVLLAVTLSGQGFGPPMNGSSGGSGGGSGGSSNAGQADSAPRATGIDLSGGPGVDAAVMERMADRAWDFDSDSFNADEGTLTWKGRTLNIGDSRAVRARFERYLSSPGPDEEEREYLTLFADIQELLTSVSRDARAIGYDSPSMTDGGDASASNASEDPVFDAWQMLFDAGKYQLDEGASIGIANQVYNIWRVRDENRKLARAQNTVRAQRDAYERYIEDLDWDADTRITGQLGGRSSGRSSGSGDADADGDNGSGGGDGAGSSGGAGQYASTRRAFQAERLAEIRSRLAAMDGKAMVQGVQAKLEFQSQLVNLLLGRRFEHAMIGANFYRHVFRGTHQDLQVGKAQLKEYFPVSNFKPTVETIEFVSREALADVRKGIDSVEALMAAGETYGALQRLQETFILGEFTPEVRRFPVEQRRELLAVYRNLRDLKDLLDLRDFGTARTVLEDVQSVADDFPGSQVLSGILSAQRLSNLSLLSAQKAVVDGDFSRAEALLGRATEIWPLNPAIERFTHEMANRADVSSQATVLFDQFFQDENWRAIYDRKTEFGGALSQDPERLARLQDIVKRLANVDIFVAQARELAAQDNPYTAWEILMNASKLAPEDPEVARAMAELAPEAADFVRVLKAAEQAEDDGSPAIALNRYLAAQDIYPTSRICRLGIERVTADLLASVRSAQTATADDEIAASVTGDERATPASE